MSVSSYLLLAVCLTPKDPVRRATGLHLVLFMRVCSRVSSNARRPIFFLQGHLF